MRVPEIKEENAGVVRIYVNEAFKERGITGLNYKGNVRYRLHFEGKDIDNILKDDTWGYGTL